MSLVSTKSIVTRNFRKIGPHLFSWSGNQSFRHIVRFTSTLSLKCPCVRPISLLPYCFHVLQPIRAIAFAYFSFRVPSVEFVSSSRSCYWLGLVTFQFVCFSHCFHQFLATTAIFSHFRTVLSSNSESVRKTAITFAYELQFWHSIYQNQIDQKQFLYLSIPANGGFDNFRIPKFASEVWVFTS